LKNRLLKLYFKNYNIAYTNYCSKPYQLRTVTNDLIDGHFFLSVVIY